VSIFFRPPVDPGSLARRTVEVETLKLIGEPKMKYLLLIYDREQDWNNMSEAEQGAIYADYMKFSQEIKDSGNYITGAQLHPVATATSVRIRDDQHLVTDGPFAETHEQLGGYYLIEAKDLDQATAIAARIPSARLGTVEIRPLVEHTATANA
jgi:hypothetical protein